MRSHLPASLKKRLPRLPDKLQVIVTAGFMAAIVAIYLMTGFSFGSAAIGSASSTRNAVI